MGAKAGHAVVSLQPSFFSEKERVILACGGLSASLFRYETGVEAIRLSNSRGAIIVLPYMGQIVWSAVFDGVELAMQSMFSAPRPAQTIVETYGCLLYHAGLLRNGTPSPGDTHPLHGEMPCARMDSAAIECGSDDAGPWISVSSARDYAMGFGAHYLTVPRIVLREGATDFETVMEVENLSKAPMDLMYLCHVNFAFSEGGRIVQSVPFTPAHVVTRVAIPGHVSPTDDYRSLLAELAANPGKMAVLDEPERYDPEQVFYIKNVRRGADGMAHFMMARPEGDGFTISWDIAAMPHTIRWILANSDQRVAAFAMPATCEPEGYLAEKRKGNVRSLKGGAKVSFATRIGYVDSTKAAEAARSIEGAGQ